MHHATNNRSLRSLALKTAVSRLAPGYFAFVMGTGIVSIGLHLAKFELFSNILFALAALGYVILWVLYIWRALVYRPQMLADMRNPEAVFAYFTVVAATDVLATGLISYGKFNGITILLAGLAALLWFVFGYVLPWQVFMTRDGSPILARTNGTWFVWAVASQSLAVVLSKLQPQLADFNDVVGILAVLSWSVGVMLYAGIAILVMLRIIHHGITPEKFEPTYWVSMGALAIAVVAGSGIVGMSSTPMVDATRKLISGTVAIFWGFCAWLIPMLAGAGLWRHLRHKITMKYTPAYWSMVFPMGMFSVASMSLGSADSLPLVEIIGRSFLVIACLAWALVTLGNIKAIMRTLFPQRRRPIEPAPEKIG